MTDIRFRSDVTVELVKASATDSDVATAARVSTIGGSHEEVVDLEKDEGLINFLMRDRHGSPFEHTSFTFYVEAPLFVAREHMRHRVGHSYNEESGRYKELQPVFYVPAADRPLIQVGKPGAYEFEAGSAVTALYTRCTLEQSYVDSYEAYAALIRNDVAREVARMALPVGIFTSYYVTCNARSLMHFLGLRTKSVIAAFPSFPQREIEMVAEKMEDRFAELMPITYAAFNKSGRVAP
ncbi:FAD-dependent thymidylate synthase [Streptomyces sp. ID05-39B]|uniref:FAD-dependent thymidylate synthase n=1 Tax=Streptomyces sp. ID05-39B TaxID=3028664 RepID=UPI0029B39165|nr:FAD-dependent thymidylate synthase [Streptomyces sp. ID05-39B]MDX3525118.1 FAD-dependent thymidylate synthase [Streptomyces sp. ID05-39B]